MRVWNGIVQLALPSFTILGYLLISMKLPQYGVIAGLISQVFWLYASWRAWKEANQVGILLTTLILIGVFVYGVANYWFL